MIWQEGAKWRGAKKEPTLISVMFSFLLCPSEVKYHWLKSGKGENCQSIMFDEEALDPHGVGNLLHIFTHILWSSAIGVRESAYYWCYKVLVCFWLNFKLKWEQEIAVESMLMNQDVLVMLPTACGKSYMLQMHVIASIQQNAKAFAVYQCHQRPDCQSKITWNQVCVHARLKLWWFFLDKTLSTTDIMPACCYEEDINFSEKSELPKLPVKISWLSFAAVSRVKKKNLQRSEQAHFLDYIIVLVVTPHVLVLLH